MRYGNNNYCINNLFYANSISRVCIYVNVVKSDIEEWIGAHPQQESLHDLKEKIDAYFSQHK